MTMRRHLPFLLLPMALACSPQRPKGIPTGAALQNCGEVTRDRDDAAVCLQKERSCADRWAIAATRPGEHLASNGCRVLLMKGKGTEQECVGLRQLDAWPYVEGVDCK